MHDAEALIAAIHRDWGKAQGGDAAIDASRGPSCVVGATSGTVSFVVGDLGKRSSPLLLQLLAADLPAAKVSLNPCGCAYSAADAARGKQLIALTGEALSDVSLRNWLGQIPCGVGRG